jgi:hypothetical protein
MLPAGCGRTSCPTCGPIEAWQRARCIAAAVPQRFIVVTFPQAEWGLPFQAVRRKVKRYRQTIQDLYGSCEWAWTIERGAAGNLHVNLLQKGPEKLPQRVLQERWGGIVHVQRIRSRGGASSYAMKEAMRVSGYAVKEATGRLDEHLELNGGRLAHWSRQYFDGRRIADVRSELRGESKWDWKPEAVALSPSGDRYMPATQVDRGRMLANQVRR